MRDGTGGEYLSLISLGVNPSQVFHGSGSTVDLAQNEAAAAALRYLSEKGLDNLTSAAAKSSSIMAADVEKTNAVVRLDSEEWKKYLRFVINFF